MVDDRILGVARLRMKAGSRMPIPPRALPARWAFADHIDRLVANKSAPSPRKGKARGEIRGETIALTAVLC